MLRLLPLLLVPSPALARAPRAQETAPQAAPSFPDARVLLWESGVQNAYPRWSADGRRILYESNRSGKWRIHAMGADGTDDRALTDGKANDSLPDWSPDGERVAFVSDRDGNEEIYVMRMDGSGLENLSRSPARDIHPYWTPDGKSILFNSTRDAGERLQIWEVALDGSPPRRLVESPDDDTCARVDPAGKRFLYLTNLAIGQDDVMLRRRDGSDAVNLTHDRAPDGWPTWTPDGRVVFSSARGGRFALFVMEASGGDARAITRPAAPWEDARACVARDGRVVFNRGDGRTIGICVAELPAATAKEEIRREDEGGAERHAGKGEPGAPSRSRTEPPARVPRRPRARSPQMRPGPALPPFVVLDDLLEVASARLGRDAPPRTASATISLEPR